MEPRLGTGPVLYVRILSGRWTAALGQMSTGAVVIRKSSLFLPHRAACGMSVSQLETGPVPPAAGAR